MTKEKLYLFDIDGTLTKPRQKMNPEFLEVFMEWASDKKVYLVTGSDFPKVIEQLGEEVLDACDGVFTCSGNVFRVNGRVVYRNHFEITNELRSDLELYLDNSAWKTRTGRHFEIRPGMLNFSTVGRNANQNMRETYNRWDKRVCEREDIVDYLSKLHPELEVAIGGSISVDIYPKGKNKSQVVEKLKEIHGEADMVFVGDRCQPGGNDHSLAILLDSIDGSCYYNVHGPEETRSLLEYDEIFT